MKKHNDNDAPKAEEGFELRLHPRPSTPLTLQIPVETLKSLERVAASRDMTVDTLVKFYVGQGLRQDLAKLFADRVLETTEQVLTRHIQSEAEVSAILKEIRGEAA
jgi:hypothetical protein